MVYWLNKPRGMLEEHEKRFVSREPKASDLQAFPCGLLVNQ